MTMKKVRLMLCMIAALACSCATTGEGPLEKSDRIVFLGDSITEAGVQPKGYVTLTSNAIAAAYPDLGVEVIGAGISGHKVRDCLKRMDRDVLEKDPTIVLIYIGINDVWWWNGNWGKGTTKPDFEAGLHKMIEQIDAVGARVILCTPTVIGEKADGTNEYDAMLDEYSEISRKVASATNSQMLDLRQHFLSYLKQHNPENLERGVLTSDGVHLNETGNAFLSGLVLDALHVVSHEPMP
ncbi:MAG: lysophospholipase L1-like esterase [Candidatus Paceibacteria bacterium]|jgi:lysophospholipase L1-like esterase